MTYTTFTDGAGASFVNGSAPGLSSAVMNGFRNFCLPGWFDSLITSDGSGNETVVSLIAQYIKLSPTAVVLMGSVSGNISLYQVIRGTYKEVFVKNNNFNSAGSFDIVLPTAFTSYALVEQMNCCNCQLKLAGTAQNIDVLIGLAAGGGTTATQTTFNVHSHGAVKTGFDTLTCTSNSGGTGALHIRGI